MKAPPPRQTATLDGQTIEYLRSGAGRPVIVLLNGAGCPLMSWYKLHPAIEGFGTAFAYSRPGIGKSSRATAPQTGDVVIATLRKLLAAQHLEPPYILVGHSLGGLYANLFARLFPREIAAVVLLEATAPEDVALMETHQGLVQRALKAAFSLVDVLRRRGKHGEIECIADTVRQIADAGDFPSVPLIVVTGSKMPPSWLISPIAVRARNENQRALCAMSPHGRQILATRSGHFPQLSEPATVISAIAEVVDAVRRVPAAPLVQREAST